MLGIVLAAILLGPIGLLLRKIGHRVMIDHAPASRLRRYGLAFWLVAFGTLVPFVSALVLVECFRDAGMISPAWEPLVGASLQATIVAGLINALGSALLQRRQPSWWLLPIADETAAQLRPWTVAAALVAVISISLSVAGDTTRISGFAVSLANIIETTVHLALVFTILTVIGRIRLRSVAATVDDTFDDQRLAGVAIIALVPWAAALAATAALLLGYIALALMLARLLLWLPVVLAALYLTLVTIDDLCTEIIAGKSALGRTLHDAFGLRRSVIEQTGVGLSALLRVMMIVFACGLAFVPFGSNFSGLVEQAVELSGGATIGQITVSPGEILRAIAVLVAGLLIVRVAQNWLVERYLPATELDTAARHSIGTVARYVGLLLAALWALAALGIGFERIALILSALSVGIGFGLQAITQNFVSGLILLIERPVKIGDWVRFGDQEGDIKRIRVRATEIEVSDRSTLIVPNSELIRLLFDTALTSL